MPLTLASVFSFIPTNIWRPLKKFVTRDDTVVFDLPFKLSTKYTPGLLMVMLCLSFANQFVRNVEMDCSSNSDAVASQGRGGYGQGGTVDAELTDFCWNYETFLVVKALDPKMRGKVTYPGVSGYNKQEDDIIVQRYYKYVWLIVGKLMVISFLPYFAWKVWATKKIKPIVEVVGTPDVPAEDRRLAYFLESTGFNGSFGYYYLGCKLFAMGTPFVQWYYLCGFIGKRYKYYGIDVVQNFMDESAPWPNPMDALFPKMAKCEFSRYGFGGDMETKSAHCQLPMNNLTQWSFFIYWWWIAIIFFINVLSFIKIIFFLFPPVRRYSYRKFISTACREDVEIARTNGQIIPKHMKHKKSDVISVNLGFGDWLVLSFVKRNLVDWQFRDLIRKMVTTENYVLQLKEIPIPMTIVPTCAPMGEGGKGDPGGGHPGAPPGPEYGWHFDQVDGGGHKAKNMEMGFNIPKGGVSVLPLPPNMQNMQMGFVNHAMAPGGGVGVNSLPTYSACGTISTDSDTPESGSSSSTETTDASAGSSKNMPPGCLPQYALNISKPVKIDRINLNKGGGKMKGDKKESKGNKAQAPPPPRTKHSFFGRKPKSPPTEERQFDEENW